jgi:hypothetical protein
MAEFKYFRNTLTGKVGYYPADFADLFYDTFIEVDSNAADCVDCWLKDEPDEVITDAPDPVVAASNDKNKDK